jgi:DNA-binding transcriptional LysR family regulator
MAKILDWDDHIGRRLRLRDLRVFFTVVQAGSLAKAATQLRVSQPAVSQVIADLEHALGAKLFDRSSRGVEPTVYARALLKRGRAAFDELKQGIRDIEFLADPTAGELTIGYPESIAATVLPQIVERFFERYPRVVMRADIVPNPEFKFPGLRDRTHDLIFARMPSPLPDDYSVEDLNVEVLFNDPLVVVAGTNSPWGRHRKVDLAELVGERWILSPPGTLVHARVAEAFKARGLEGPKASLVTYSMDLRARLPAHGRFVTAIPKSLLRVHGDRHALKILPVELPARPWPVTILTLKSRTLSPVVERFITCAREVTKTIAGRPDGSRRKSNIA